MEKFKSGFRVNIWVYIYSISTFNADKRLKHTGKLSDDKKSAVIIVFVHFYYNLW